MAFHSSWTSLVAQLVKCLPTMWETQVWSLGWEDPLENEMATHSSTLAGKIPRLEERGRLQSTGSQRVGHNWVTSLSFFHSSIWNKSFTFFFLINYFYWRIITLLSKWIKEHWLFSRSPGIWRAGPWSLSLK